MNKSVRSLALLALIAVPLAAQTGGRAGGAAAGSFAAGQARAVWISNANYILQSAMDMPEAKYSFKATPAVRSFGELIGHVAGSQYMFCAAALGDAAKAEDDIEKTKTAKADLVAAMKASITYCEKAYAISDAASRGEITMFDNKRTKLWALMMNAAHDGEHYGNIVTYLRLNGMVPPSSK